jgi:LPXTG-site transpeptidase (sortase) family protein
MTKWKKWLSTLLIIAGIGIMAFPIGNKLYINYWNQRLLAAYDNELMLNEEAPPMAESDFLALQAIYENNDALNETSNEAETTEVANGENTTESTTVVETTEAATEQPKTVDKSVIGKIKISKIDLIMPVLMGATEKNLNRGAAVISGTSDFGVIGNVGIAGHRGRSYGIFFNRLDEIEQGDIIEVTTNNTVYKYTVYETLIVEPTEVSVLYRNDKDKILTLVTCDPVKNPTHRLIIHALQNP